MSKWIDPVTDRTQADILARTAKAFLNVADWLRIYGNTEQAQQALNILLGQAAQITAISEPAITQFVAVADVNALIANIDSLRETAALPAGTGVVALKHDYIAGSGAEAPDYADVNDWERDLELIRDLLAYVADYLIPCGVANCGQARLWQNQFRRWAFVPAAASPVRRPRCGLVVCGTGMMRQNLWRRYG